MPKIVMPKIGNFGILGPCLQTNRDVYRQNKVQPMIIPLAAHKAARVAVRVEVL